VHERGRELREIGAGIFLWENALRALEEIGAFEQATLLAEDIDAWQLFDERSRLLQGHWMASGVRLKLVLRTELHRALADTAQRSGVEIVTESTVVSATADGELVLEDGTRHQADLIVGADGVFSRVRDSLQLGIAARDLEDGCGRHLIPRIDSDPKNRTLEYWKGGRRIGICPCSPDEVYVYLCCPADDALGRERPLNTESWASSFPQVRDVIERVPRDVGRWASFHDVLCRSWQSGRVAIIGDAAHAMSPNLGQGACLAMTTGVALGQALDVQDDVPSALAAWEQAQRPIVDATQNYSRIYGRIGTRWPKRGLAVRSALVWGIGRSKRLQRKANAAAHDFPQLDSGGGRRVEVLQ
jgi:2-polyprenyl-6-methoxyphenol hydroxylase-like FAD-dependent oxidoreductase